MKCKQVQELLLTDFLDAEMDRERAREVEDHLKVCAQCQEFEKAVHERVVRPLSDVSEIEPPQRVWQNIQAAIQRDKQRVRVPVLDTLKDQLEHVLDVFRYRKPALAFASALIIVVAVVATLYFSGGADDPVESYLGNHIDFLTSLTTDVTSEEEVEIVNLGTTIEYFFM